MAARILVVDDEESIRFTFTIILSDEGYEVSTAENFEQAMALLRHNDFDLVFVDIIMEGKSGINLLQEISGMDLQVPIVIITGAPSIETATESLRQGAFDYIIKPIHDETLLRTANIALKHKSLVDEKEKCRRNFESIFRSVQEGIMTLDPGMTITAVNNSAQALCDLREEDTIGKNPMALSRSCGANCLETLQQAFASRGYVKTTYIECLAARNPEQVVSMTVTPLREANNNFCGFVVLINDETELNRLKRTLDKGLNERGLIGNSSGLRKVKTMIRDLADIQTSVLITGESGTGKELVVDILHRSGERRDRPLVKVNCAALVESLLESELFGHVKGAFTGAIKDTVGRFQRADGGILFLDEIGDISPQMQARLLRVIETMEFERVGDSAPIRVNVRIVAATNKDLRELVSRGSFREDLYYRLKVVEIALPPLRERRGDIPILANHFLSLYNRHFGKDIKGFSSDVLALFQEYGWPGNVRELENTIEHCFVCCHDKIVTTAHLPSDLSRSPQLPDQTRDRNDENECKAVQEALVEARWNKSKAADLLGISRRTMYRKLQKYNL